MRRLPAYFASIIFLIAFVTPALAGSQNARYTPSEASSLAFDPAYRLCSNSDAEAPISIPAAFDAAKCLIASSASSTALILLQDLDSEMHFDDSGRAKILALRGEAALNNHQSAVWNVSKLSPEMLELLPIQSCGGDRVDVRYYAQTRKLFACVLSEYASAKNVGFVGQDILLEYLLSRPNSPLAADDQGYADAEASLPGLLALNEKQITTVGSDGQTKRKQYEDISCKARALLEYSRSSGGGDDSASTLAYRISTLTSSQDSSVQNELLRRTALCYASVHRYAEAIPTMTALQSVASAGQYFDDSLLLAQWFLAAGDKAQAIKYVRVAHSGLNEHTANALYRELLPSDFAREEAARALDEKRIRAASIARARDEHAQAVAAKKAAALADSRQIAQERADRLAFAKQYSGDRYQVAIRNGEPCHESTSDTRIGRIEIWYYDCISGGIGSNSFTFLNGRLQDRTSL